MLCTIRPPWVSHLCVFQSVYKVIEFHGSDSRARRYSKHLLSSWNISEASGLQRNLGNFDIAFKKNLLSSRRSCSLLFFNKNIANDVENRSTIFFDIDNYSLTIFSLFKNWELMGKTIDWKSIKNIVYSWKHSTKTTSVHRFLSHVMNSDFSSREPGKKWIFVHFAIHVYTIAPSPCSLLHCSRNVTYRIHYKLWCVIEM